MWALASQAGLSHLPYMEDKSQNVGMNILIKRDFPSVAGGLGGHEECAPGCFGRYFLCLQRQKVVDKVPTVRMSVIKPWKTAGTFLR